MNRGTFSPGDKGDTVQYFEAYETKLVQIASGKCRDYHELEISYCTVKASMAVPPKVPPQVKPLSPTISFL